MLKILKKINILMDKKQKRAMGKLLLLMVISAGLETGAVMMVMAVVQLILDPVTLEQGKVYQWICDLLHLQDTVQFSVLAILFLIALYIAKNSFQFVLQRSLYRFVYSNQFQTASNLMKNFVRRDYEYYLNAETSIIQRSITADVSNMYALIMAVLQIASEAIVAVFLVVALAIQDPIMTIVISVLLLVTLAVIKNIIKPIMNRTGKENQDYGASMFAWIAQTIQGIKEIKVAGREQYFIGEYCKVGEGYVKAMERFSLFNNTPKLLIETVSIAGLLGYIMVLIVAGADVSGMVSLFAAFGIAAMRLLPAASRINNQMTSMAFNEPFFFNVSDNLVEETNAENTDISYAVAAKEKLPVTKEVRLADITYHYPNSDKLIFNHASVSFPIGKSIGIVGTSGAGKTTIIDILLGLLKLQGGKVLADDVDIQTHYREWLANVGYIPQMIFLLDADIRKNVAFGIPEEEIDDQRLWYALREAQLDEFVKTLPEGIATGIGERGIRLSGGQRQRIGIARALYNDPEVLILDEATSALDNDTEAAIMDSINRLHGKKTLVIIAHRLQTIEKCDMVFRVEDGGIYRER
ncbi:MAG: ABC transporter ATP-binding protein [Lachnospiraceae bacterium]|jgi:ABC-type multidrug transport system fused ATPase/permease subunit|nr:ABC transporter ATP-binding protein [Lachnospiraceae bacterium]MCX4377833.1 ABC transporter ATP-binding protein [Lachnospiraceae bacterium]